MQRQWTVPLPAVQQAAAAVSACPCRRRGCPQCRPPAGCGCPQAASVVRAADRRCLPAAPTWPGTQGCPRNRTPRPCPPGVRECGRLLAGRLLSAAVVSAAPLSRAGTWRSLAADRPCTPRRRRPVDANRRIRCLRRQQILDAGDCPDQGVRRTAGCCSLRTPWQCPRCVRNRGRPAMPSGRPGVHRGHRRLRGVWCYRKRSPDRWPLVWCCHRR
jgi:hypothetical protein